MIACPQCGKLNPENFNYCLDCGAELHPETTHSAESQFFIDLSSESPDVKQARKDADEVSPPQSFSSPTGEEASAADSGDSSMMETIDAPVTNAGAASTVTEDQGASQVPGSEVIELSIDDLEDGFDEAVGSASSLPFNDQGLDEEIDEAPGEEIEDEDLQIVEAPQEGMFDGVDLMDPETEEAQVQLDQPAMGDDLSEDPETDLDTGISEIDFKAGEQPGEDLEVDMTQQEDLTCMKCGGALNNNVKFCPQCGTSVEAPAEDAAGKTMFMHVGSSESIDSQLIGRLMIIEPSGKEGRSFNLVQGENLCGRTSDPVLLDDNFVSPKHCSFSFENDQMTLKDLGSLNGVFIKVKGEIELKSGLLVRVGQQLMKFLAFDDFEVDGEMTSGDDTTFLASPVGDIWGKLVHITKEGRVIANYTMQKAVYTIGRDTGDIIFSQDGFVSGAHARISLKDGKYFLADLGSSNGTFMQVQDYTLNAKDMVLVGKKLMRYERI